MRNHSVQQETNSRSAAAAARSGTSIWNDSSSDAATAQLVGMEEEEPTQGKFHKAPVQLVGMEEEEEPMQGKFDGAPIQRAEDTTQVPRPNNTGLPDNLKSGIENLSGYSMDDVKVHYNSSKPAQLNAHAYAQGTDIHVAPGQERHLPHEAWHVVQQKQGRVKPTMQVPSTQFKSSVPVNDDAGLEKEADVMGERARFHATNRLGGFVYDADSKPDNLSTQSTILQCRQMDLTKAVSTLSWSNKDIENSEGQGFNTKHLLTESQLQTRNAQEIGSNTPEGRDFNTVLASGLYNEKLRDYFKNLYATKKIRDLAANDINGVEFWFDVPESVKSVNVKLRNQKWEFDSALNPVKTKYKVNYSDKSYKPNVTLESLHLEKQQN